MNPVLQTALFRSAVKEIGKYIARESGSRKVATDFLRRINENVWSMHVSLKWEN